MRLKNFFNYKVPAKIYLPDGYSLPSILIIFLITCTMLFSLLYLTYFYLSDDIKRIEKTLLDNECESAINITVCDTTFINCDTILVNIHTKEIAVEVRQRGLLFNLSASSVGRLHKSKVKYITGLKNSLLHERALTISKPNFRGAVTGDTKIIGDLFATTERLSPGRITGIERSTGEYHNGQFVMDENIAPNFFKHNYLISWFDFMEKIKNNEFSYTENLILDQTMVESFADKSVIIVSGSLTIEDSIYLDKKRNTINIFASGGIIFKDGSLANGEFNFFTDSTITIGQNSVLENIVLTSDGDCEINKAELRFSQVFSKSNISMNNSFMEFPGIICAYVDCDLPENLENRIEISSSTLNGTVMLLCSTIGLSSNKSIISFKSGSKIQGLVYSENFTESECTITGSLYTYELFFYKSPTEYRNWLVNTNINSELLDEDFLLPFGFSLPINTGVLKREWIN